MTNKVEASIDIGKVVLVHFAAIGISFSDVESSLKIISLILSIGYVAWKWYNDFKKKRMNRISKHITYKEATESSTAKRNGISNKPNNAQNKAMRNVAKKVFEPVRSYLGKPIYINSFFRSEELNITIGGSKNSQHCKGEAIDMDANSKEDNKKIFEYIKKNLEFDQLINEFDYSWIHVSYKYSGKNRGQVLEAKKVRGRTKYVPA